MHEILHVVLQHCLRQCERDADLFSIACDIVVNSNILLSNNMDIKKITLHDQGESIHIAPDGKEGYEYTAEQIYSMIISSNKKEETKEHVEKMIHAKTLLVNITVNRNKKIIPTITPILKMIKKKKDIPMQVKHGTTIPAGGWKKIMTLCVRSG